MKSITKAIVTILVLAQYAPAVHADAAATASIEVAGENGSPRHFDAAALARLPQHTVRAQAHGQTVTCTGANVIDLLAAVGAPHGAAVRGKALALYARVRAADGYRAVFALADLDPDMRGAVPIVTASCDGKPLDAKIGPFRLVVPDDKRPARWVRQVTAIDLLRAP
ncbi:MAG: hypothetical protein JSR27_04645 [Proteobacteria bacterium]|nr:hypothetical protein [Pseudomonadota bacterium]